MTIREFKVSVDESKIDDLYKRIDLTRWPDEVNDEIWTLGTKKSFLKDAVQYLSLIHISEPTRRI